MEPAELEKILKELLLPDTERIRRVWAEPSRARGRGRLWEKPGLDPQPPTRPRSSSRLPFGTLLPCLRFATCWPLQQTHRRVTCSSSPKF